MRASGPNRGRQFSGLRFDAFFRLRITRSSRSSICCGVNLCCDHSLSGVNCRPRKYPISR